ncbi:FkbM family methyltransferase [Acidocella facilis]|uniref:FkbM family methyltransferase n=1 Tax=Acidocella facilis TaxID=525 RepID=UPI001EED446E|nr:FkbM family methyltransferase [Acidocella facilis]
MLHPDMLDKELCAGRVLIVGVFNPFNDLGEIVRAMRPLGFAEIFWGADLPDALGSSFNDFWLSGRAPLVEAFASIRETYARLADEASRKTFESVLRFRALDGDQPDPVPDLVTQYLPPDLPPFDRPISFLDGGAYDGDTYRSLRAGGVDIAAWHAFEPDPDNFTKLASFAADCGGALSLIPCGLAARTGQVHFSAGRDTGSRITAEADATIAIQCMAIDEAFINVPFDYVKLDIEGAELSALDGMRGMIARYKPRLAVSAYHRPEDLWEIPSKLKALLPGSDIYMRQHQRNTFEIVAYAVVANR